MSPTAQRWVFHVGGIALFLLLWEIAGRRLGPALLAPPSAVAAELGVLLTQGKPLLVLADSLRQMIVGYLLGCAVGMPLGIAIGRSRVADAILYPWLSMLIVTSVASLLPLFVLGFGTGFGFRVVVVFTACVFYITLTAYQGARDVGRRWIDVGRSFSASPLQRFRKIILPAVFPYLLTGARIGLGQALRGMIIAEMFVIVGFGGLIHEAGLEVSTSSLLALLVLLMAIALVTNEALRWAAGRLAPWYVEHDAQRRTA
jgi:ABC-type nitrate/sulfonate/bicarbonate transport system permease component